MEEHVNIVFKDNFVSFELHLFWVITGEDITKETEPTINSTEMQQRSLIQKRLI
jgi:hypothetical protein